MKFSLVATAAAFASGTLAVTQNCKAQGLTPYCCDSVIGLGDTLPFTIGVLCTKEAFGKKTKCPAQTAKQCCDVADTALGLITVCTTANIIPT